MDEFQVLEQFIHGTNDMKVKERALTTNYEDVSEALDFAAANETISRSQSSSTSVNFVSSKKPSGIECYYCKTPGHTCNECPKLRLAVCKICKKRGHTAKFCKSRSRTKVGTIGKDKRKEHSKKVYFVEESDDEALLDTNEYIMHLDGSKSVYGKIGGINQDFILDTGASSNIIPLGVWKVLKEKGIKVFNQSKQTSKTFRGFSNEPLEVVGTFEAMLKLGEQEGKERFYILAPGEKCLLGYQSAIKYEIITVNEKNVGSKP